MKFIILLLSIAFTQSILAQELKYKLITVKSVTPLCYISSTQLSEGIFEELHAKAKKRCPAGYHLRSAAMKEVGSGACSNFHAKAIYRCTILPKRPL